MAISNMIKSYSWKNKGLMPASFCGTVKLIFLHSDDGGGAVNV